jgi:hypothetical protein
LYSHDLGTEVWRQDYKGWGTLFRSEGSVWIGPVEGQILEFRISNGVLESSTPYEGVGTIRGRCGDISVISTASSYEGIRTDGLLLWRRDSRPGHSVFAGQLLLLTEAADQRIVAVDATDGRELWRAEPRARAGGARATVFALAIANNDRVIAVLEDNTIVTLNRDTGEIMATGGPDVGGVALITPDCVLFKRPAGLSIWDHGAISEIERFEYEAEAALLYGSAPRRVHAFCPTKDTVIWSTGHAALMAVELRPAGRERRSWSDHLAGALMPIGQAPFSWGPYLYYEWKGTSRLLRVYASSPASDDDVKGANLLRAAATRARA